MNINTTLIIQFLNDYTLIMRDVNMGWAIRYAHANTASFFFIFVYLHIARGLYYGSYRSPRTLLWSIGVIILVLMMAIICGQIDYTNNNVYTDDTLLSGPFISPRIRGINRIGPHDKLPLDIFICGLLGDWWADLIPTVHIPSVRFQIEQGDNHSEYLNSLGEILYELGYVNSSKPKWVQKSYLDKKWENHRITTFSYSNLVWIYS